MIQNHEYRNHYVAFVNEITNQADAEKVPQEILKTDPGKVWYIPIMVFIIFKSPTRSELFSIAVPSLLERPLMNNYFKDLISQIH